MLRVSVGTAPRTMSGDPTTTVLVADDEPAIVEGHATRLEPEYDVRTAHDGREAIEQLDASVDVVLLDRRMPEVPGEDVLAHVRDRGLDCRVAMLTGVEPSFDILEMGFDDYVCKPVGREELFDVVERLRRRARYDRRLQEYFSLASKAAALEADHPPEELAAHAEYDPLLDRLDELRADLDAALAELPPEERFSVATRPAASN